MDNINDGPYQLLEKKFTTKIKDIEAIKEFERLRVH